MPDASQQAEYGRTSYVNAMRMALEVKPNHNTKHETVIFPENSEFPNVTPLTRRMQPER